MTLTTHIIVAAAVAKPLAAYNPAFAFLAAFASHYLSDALPHWDYMLSVFKNEEDKEKIKFQFTKSSIVANALPPAVDAAIGTLIAAAIIWPDSPEKLIYLAAVVLGGTLPDILQGAYLAGARLLKPLQTFHDTIHTKIKLGPYPLVGIPFQILIFLTALYFLF